MSSVPQSPQDAPPPTPVLRQLAQVATPGPWFAKENDLIGGWCVMPVDDVPSNGRHEIADFTSRVDAEFIAAARTAIPALLAKVARLERQIDRWGDQATMHVQWSRQ